MYYIWYIQEGIMFGNKKELRELKDEIIKLKFRLSKVEHPAKFKVGDKVMITNEGRYKSMYCVVTKIKYEEPWFSIADYGFWFYSVYFDKLKKSDGFTDSNLKLVE